MQCIAWRDLILTRSEGLKGSMNPVQVQSRGISAHVIWVWKYTLHIIHHLFNGQKNLVNCEFNPVPSSSQLVHWAGHQCLKNSNINNYLTLKLELSITVNQLLSMSIKMVIIHRQHRQHLLRDFHVELLKRAETIDDIHIGTNEI